MKAVHLAFLTSGTNLRRLIGQHRKRELGQDTTSNVESRMAKTKMPRIHGDSFA
jgi:hypothetical protein